MKKKSKCSKIINRKEELNNIYFKELDKIRSNSEYISYEEKINLITQSLISQNVSVELIDLLIEYVSEKVAIEYEILLT